MVWRTAFNITFDPWQEWLLRAVMEVYPAGHEKAGQLRYRQVVISMGRQNGKTELGAILGIWGLLRAPNSNTVGIASSADQARLVYDRANQAIAANASLAKRFRKLTDTRGIRANDGARYEIKAAKSAALQGIPIHTGLVDEVHLLKTALWTDLVNGTGGRPNAIVVGITTAGDENSELLTNLYETGHDAAEGNPALTGFGFFLWEASESRVPDDDAELLALLTAANPALASGRSDAANILSDVRAMPISEVIRYRLNRFHTSTEAFMPLDSWEKCRRPFTATMPRGELVFCLDMSPSHDYASIAAAVVDEDGVTHTELVAWLVKPELGQLVRICERLWRHSPNTFAMDSYTLRDLGNELKMRGLPVTILSRVDAVNGSALLHQKVSQGKLQHAGDALLSAQLPRAKAKTMGDGYRIVPSESSFEIEAVMATVGAVLTAERVGLKPPLQIF